MERFEGSDRAIGSLEAAVRSSGLVDPGTRGVALVSGGADSAGLLAGLVACCGPERVLALHLDYGLRPDSGRDRDACRRLCAELGVELTAERPALGPGNVQAAAREARYAEAERLRAERGLEWIATGHTRTDLAETALYRLATSPGLRALRGPRPQRGAVIRPLLAVDRPRVRALVEAAGLPFRDDPTNAEPLYARNRIRNEVLPVLREIGPAAERVIAETQGELIEALEALEQEAAAALRETAAATGVVPAEGLTGLHPAIRRTALRLLAEEVAGRPVPMGRERAAEIWRLAAEPEGGVVELGGGLEARLEHGQIRFVVPAGQAEPEERRLELPGRCRFGAWEVTAELGPPSSDPGSADTAILDPDALGPLTVRAWRSGDRMRPLGLGGTKSLQDLFTDRRVPRSLRRSLPVVTSGGRVAWIAGVAVSEEFAAPAGARRTAVLRAVVASTPAA